MNRKRCNSDQLIIGVSHYMQEKENGIEISICCSFSLNPAPGFQQNRDTNATSLWKCVFCEWATRLDCCELWVWVAVAAATTAAILNSYRWVWLAWAKLWTVCVRVCLCFASLSAEQCQILYNNTWRCDVAHKNIYMKQKLAGWMGGRLTNNDDYSVLFLCHSSRSIYAFFLQLFSKKHILTKIFCVSWCWVNVEQTKRNMKPNGTNWRRSLTPFIHQSTTTLTQLNSTPGSFIQLHRHYHNHSESVTTTTTRSFSLHSFAVTLFSTSQQTYFMDIVLLFFPLTQLNCCRCHHHHHHHRTTFPFFTLLLYFGSTVFLYCCVITLVLF